MSDANSLEAPVLIERTMEEMEEMMKYLQSAMAEKKSMAKETKELTDDDVKQKLFVGSTHRFLFLDTIKDQNDGKKYKVGRWNKFLALAVITLQLYAYVQLLALIFGFVNCDLIQPETPAPTPFPTATILPTITPSRSPTLAPSIIPSDSPSAIPSALPSMAPSDSPSASPSESPSASPSDAPSDSPADSPADSPSIIPPTTPSWSPPVPEETGQFVCGLSPFIDFASEYYYIPAFFLLFCFLSQDLFEGVVLFRCRGFMAKLTALLIFLEAAFAVVTACMGSILGFPSERLGVLDTFLLIVGIIFVHEVDEQIGYWKNVQRRLGNKHPYSEGIVWTVLLLLAACVLFFSTTTDHAF